MGKKENRKIQDFDGIYAFLRHYVDFMLRMAYRRIKYVGLEKVPADGAVIYAPNHTNALMDALVILAMDRKQKVFVARADIFRNPKVAKILRFLKIMPIMRIRDGMDEVRKNTEIIHKSVDVLLDKVPFCILQIPLHRAGADRRAHQRQRIPERTQAAHPARGDEPDEGRAYRTDEGGHPLHSR